VAQDPVSITRIKNMSRVLMQLIKKPAVLMIGPPTVAQVRSGRNQKNWRMSIYHKDEWWHLGGHVLSDGRTVRWDNWAPAGKWNALGLLSASQALVDAAIKTCIEDLEIVPRFLKIEEDEGSYQKLLSWATEFATKEMNNDGTATTDSTGH
jgi:hypothetical protein